MKVKELIAMLRDGDPEDEVKVYNADNGEEWDIVDVYDDGDINIDIAPVN